MSKEPARRGPGRPRKASSQPAASSMQDAESSHEELEDVEVTENDRLRRDFGF